MDRRNKCVTGCCKGETVHCTIQLVYMTNDRGHSATSINAEVLCV